MYLRDLTFTDEGNEDFDPSGGINLEKLNMIGKVLLELHKFQVFPPHFLFTFSESVSVTHCARRRSTTLRWMLRRRGS